MSACTCTACEFRRRKGNSPILLVHNPYYKNPKENPVSFRSRRGFLEEDCSLEVLDQRYMTQH